MTRRRPITGSAVLPPGTRILRSGSHSIRFATRTATVLALSTIVAATCGALALVLGDYTLSIGDVLGALAGDRDGLGDSIVVNWRLPRMLAALLFGAALGSSGALFQSLAANPLASPDVIGFDSGSITGALLVLLVAPASPGGLATGAILGGMAAAGIVYVLAYRDGIHGFRLILVGIAVSAMFSALNQYLVIDAIRNDDLNLNAVRYWMIGSLNGIGWAHLRTPAVILTLLVPAAVALGRPLRRLEMGDDAARALGTRANPVRLGAVLVGVGLTATVTSACGPVAFVALAAPQIGRRLVRSPGISVAAAATTGAVLLIASDLVATHLFPGRELPVGAMTVSLGGCYFVWLLFQERSRR